MCVNTLAKDVEDLAKGTYHVIPSGDDAFHIQVTWEERDNTVGHDFAVLDQNTTEVTYNGGVVPDFDPRAYGDLVTPSGNDLYLRHRTVREGVQKRDSPMARRNSG